MNLEGDTNIYNITDIIMWIHIISWEGEDLGPGYGGLLKVSGVRQSALPL